MLSFTGSHQSWHKGSRIGRCFIRCGFLKTGTGITAVAALTLIILLFFRVGEENAKILPLLQNRTGGTIIQRVGKNKFLDASFMIVSKSGRIIVADPASMPEQSEFPLAPDVITSSHFHFDHYDGDFISASSGLKLISREGEFYLEDIRIHSIPSNHAGFYYFGDKDEIPSPPNNIIYVFEVDGLRIAHMGDMGQNRLHDWQLSALGEIDVMITKMNNPVITLKCSGPLKSSLRVIEQVKPRVTIPTHSTERCAREFGNYVGGFEKTDNIYVVDTDRTSGRKVVYVRNTLGY